MKKSLQNWCLLAVLLFGDGFYLPKKQATSIAFAASLPEPASAYYTLADFSKVKKFDTHVHINTPDASVIQQAAQDNMRLLTINVDAPHYPPIEEQQKLAIGHVKAFPDRVAYATTFSVEGFNRPDWQAKTLAYLKESFAQGALAVKIWKNIGMQLQDPDGKFIMIDDPRFDPVINFIAQHKIPLIGHLGEPKNCWQPIEQMDVLNNKNYYKAHPEYHMYLHPEYPTYEQHIAARDRMLAKHPQVRFVGAHLGSLEWSVDELAARLDRFPNMAVDMAARIPHFQVQSVSDWQKVHDFFIKYQDRLLYATDLAIDASKSPAAVNQQAHQTWLRDWKYFTSHESMNVPSVAQPFKGLRLPRNVIDKIYRRNAEKWLLGVN